MIVCSHLLLCARGFIPPEGASDCGAAVVNCVQDRIVDGSALSLLMLGVFADNHDLTLALDDLAFLAHGFYGRSNFHFLNLLFTSPSNPAAGQIVRRHLNRDFVTWENTNVVHPEFTGNVCQNDMAIANIHFEHRVGQSLDDRTLKFDFFVFRHA